MTSSFVTHLEGGEIHRALGATIQLLRASRITLRPLGSTTLGLERLDASLVSQAVHTQGCKWRLGSPSWQLRQRGRVLHHPPPVKRAHSPDSLAPAPHNIFMSHFYISLVESGAYFESPLNPHKVKGVNSSVFKICGNVSFGNSLFSRTFVECKNKDSWYISIV